MQPSCMKEDRIGTQLSVNEAKIFLSTQVVFACGFIKCKEIFEAPNGNNTARAVKDYFSHVGNVPSYSPIDSFINYSNNF
jgi:hypothetical protein